ncbi:hypothetical protein AAFF_G00387990 [Aldrovandia affinis]|uniref:Uncharacterized protein n=1 Tax=Aldrovandia affinis TaxID=143900 RepID=A0AAD7WLF4_9TELE|nr:hypothetical protein AAFF_G00387990 [Aldrovandia affinis]
MMKTLTKKLRRHSLNEIHPFQLKISYHGSEEGGESEDSEGENQELAQIDRERRRNCGLTPLATSQQHNQGALSPARLRRLRVLLDPALDRHSSEEELECLSRDFLQPAGEGRKWAEQQQQQQHSSASSDEEVKDLASPPHSLRGPARPLILTHFDQPATPYRRHRQGYAGEPGRPSLDLEKMQQKMLLKKHCGGKTRTIKIRNLSGNRLPEPPPPGGPNPGPSWNEGLKRRSLCPSYARGPRDRPSGPETRSARALRCLESRSGGRKTGRLLCRM